MDTEAVESLTFIDNRRGNDSKLCPEYIKYLVHGRPYTDMIKASVAIWP